MTLGGRFFHFLAIIVLVLLEACDKSVPVEVNGYRPYKLSTDCGVVTLNASTFSKAITLYQHYDKKFDIDLDSLLFQVFPKNLEIESLTFFDGNSQVLDSRRFSIENNVIVIRIELNQSTLVEDGVLVIEPCSYIKCNGVSLIQDTIKVHF